MIKLQVIFSLFVYSIICASNMVYAETAYYKLCKKIEGGKTYSNTGGGQFVTFENGICYDSDKYGISVGNGDLKYFDTVNGNLRYYGESYWGKVFYIFKPDKSVLNVWISDNLIYVYKRMATSYNENTCTLIKASPSKAANYSEPAFYNTPNNISLNMEDRSPTRSVNQNSNSTQPMRQFKCAYCNGAGRIERNDNAPASFGQNRANKRCNECGKVYDPTVFNHYHQQCRHCGGTGYTK